MKKIVFIEPKSPGYHIYSRWGLPRLGSVQLATILNKAGYDAKVFVEDIKGIDFDEVFSADAVGISTITSTAPRAYEIANQIRKAGIPVFMGGPHVSFLSDEALDHCDFVVRGETENTIVDFVNTMFNGGSRDDIAGLSYRLDGKAIHNPLSKDCVDLDLLPDPDLSLIQGRGILKKDLSVTPIMTSRGCPFGCNFCSVTKMFGRSYRFRSTRNVMRELKAKKPEWIFFYDDNFAANRERTKELLREMIANDITPPWGAQVRVDIADDPELLKLMRAANSHFVYIGLESMNPKTLKALNKGQTVEQIEKSVRLINRAGINIHGMFIFGADDDDLSTIKETVRFAKRLNLTSVQFMILTPLPGTEVFYRMEREERLISRDWSYYDAHHVVFKPRKISFFELQRETMRAMVKFYSIPRILSCLNRFDILKTSVRAYGHRMSKKAKRANEDFQKHLKDLYHSTEKSFLKARKTTEDLKEFFSSYKFERVLKQKRSS